MHCIAQEPARPRRPAEARRASRGRAGIEQCSQFVVVVYPELAEHVVKVGFGGADRDDQFWGDLVVGQAPGGGGASVGCVPLPSVGAGGGGLRFGGQQQGIRPEDPDVQTGDAWSWRSQTVTGAGGLPRPNLTGPARKAPAPADKPVR